MNKATKLILIFIALCVVINHARTSAGAEQNLETRIKLLKQEWLENPHKRLGITAELKRLQQYQDILNTMKFKG